MKWVLIAVGVVVALILLVTVIGAFLPREHTASRAIVLRQPPETVWATIRNLEGIAAWFPEGARVKVEVAEERRPAKLVTRVVPERRGRARGARAPPSRTPPPRAAPPPPPATGGHARPP